MRESSLEHPDQDETSAGVVTRSSTSLGNSSALSYCSESALNAALELPALADLRILYEIAVLNCDLPLMSGRKILSGRSLTA